MANPGRLRLEAKNGFVEQNLAFREVLTRSPGFSYDYHAITQMRKRRITRQDVRSALVSGVVVGVEIAYETEERWKISGFDVDGYALFVVVQAVERDSGVMLIVTVFPEGE